MCGSNSPDCPHRTIDRLEAKAATLRTQLLAEAEKVQNERRLRQNVEMLFKPATDEVERVTAEAAVMREALEAFSVRSAHADECYELSQRALSTDLAKRGRLVADVVAAARQRRLSRGLAQAANTDMSADAGNENLSMLFARSKAHQDAETAEDAALAKLDAKESILTEVVGAYEPKVSEPPEATQRRMRGDATEAGDGD